MKKLTGMGRAGAASVATTEALMRPINGPPPILATDASLPLDAEPTLHLRIIAGRVAQLWMSSFDMYGERQAWWVDLETGARL